VLSALHVRKGNRIPTPGLSVTRAGPAGAKHRRTVWYRQAKDNEARREGGRASERLIVPQKPGNTTRTDPGEGRGRRVAEPLEGNRAGASEPGPVFTKQQRIAELAKPAPQMGFTSLNHHLDLIWLVEAYQRTRKDGAPGVDGQTAQDYGLTLLGNLETLLDRAKSGT
jgi:hypothetical protein